MLARYGERHLPMPIEYSDQHRDITVNFLIAQEGNPTTGHKWVADFDSAILQLVHREFVARGSGIGAGGIERFRFKALAAGDTRLVMTYKRRWETIARDNLVFLVRSVKEGGNLPPSP
jgi:predicted secreted protein